MSNFIVMTASAQMPSSVRSPYGKVAVVEVESGVIPKMISERARGVIRIVELWDRRHKGGPRSAYALALVEAKELADKLNGAT